MFDEAYATADVEMDLAGIAYRAREAAGLTQAEVARKIGTTRSAIAAIESGASAPTAAVFAFLARDVSRRLIISIGRDTRR